MPQTEEGRADSSQAWRGHLRLHYTRARERTVARSAHEGPLRVLQPLYPEGSGICHHVIVHPPGGVVAGDELHIDVHVGAGAHALITTPGATRFYRSDAADKTAVQAATLQVEAGARLEWLPLEAIAYSGCQARNSVRMELAPGAEMMGWDVLALGLPAAKQPFVDGWFQQQLNVPGVWLERGRVAASDAAFLQHLLGWGGNTVLATLWFAGGSPIAAPTRQALLESAQATIAASRLATTAGVTAPQSAVVVLRALASGVEPAMQLLTRVHAAWRHVAWSLTGEPPRIWRT